MMKKAIKKLLAVLLAVAMLCAMAVPALAASVNTSNHTFTVYQIFTGKYDDTKKTLSDVDWNNNSVNGAAILTELKSNSIFADCSTAADVAEKLAEHQDQAQAFAEVVAKHLTDSVTSGVGSVTMPSAGYYLIVDTTDDLGGKYDARNLSLLEVSAAGAVVTPQVKTSIPTVEKKVKDINDTTDSDFSGWQDSADHDATDSIPYQLTATLGDLTHFNHYYVQFVDKMTHLTYTGVTSVKVNGTEVDQSAYTVDWDSTNKTLTVTLNDVMANGAISGSTVVVEYNATLDADANLGATGNPNIVYLNYSNNPTYDGNGLTTPSDIGKTTEDKNIVFTYEIAVDKVDQDSNALPGAAFELFKKNKDGSWKSLGAVNVSAADPKKVDNDTLTHFAWSHIDDGEYKISEVITPDGYNSIQDIEFTVTAEHDITADNPTLTRLTCSVNSGNADLNDGTITFTIKNNLGSTLPSTGGIGTTIFYVAGGGLMVAAIVLLVTKKRMENK